MKLIVVLTVTLAIFGSTIANEQRKMTIKFYNCLACKEDSGPFEEFENCAEDRPEEINALVEGCKAQVMPGATIQERREILCKNEGDDGGVIGKLYDCTSSSPAFKDHSAVMEKFRLCAIEPNKKYCSGS